MEKDLHDEIMGKAYDSRLMKRLLKYARPYWKHLLLALILLVSLTGLELLNPYILKVAIDDYLNGNEKPMYELSLDSPYDGVDLGGYKYVKARDLEDEDIDKLSQAPLKRIMKEEGAYYIVDYEAEGVDGGFLLSQNDYERFRKQDISGINRLSIFYLLVILLTFLFNYFQVLILNYTAQKIIFNMREEIFNHVKSLAVSYFDKNPIGGWSPGSPMIRKP